jgi:hypothetical protein
MEKRWGYERLEFLFILALDNNDRFLAQPFNRIDFPLQRSLLLFVVEGDGLRTHTKSQTISLNRLFTTGDRLFWEVYMKPGMLKYRSTLLLLYTARENVHGRRHLKSRYKGSDWISEVRLSLPELSWEDYGMRRSPKTPLDELLVFFTSFHG